jgi:ProP effector
MSNSKKRTAAAIARLADAFPKAFTIDPARRAPLRIGIADDIAATGVIPPKELRFALMVYCSSAGYLRSLKEGTARLDLGGEVAGVVTADEAVYARDKLNAKLAYWQAKRLEQQRSANLDHGAVGSQRCASPGARPTDDSAAGRRETGAREQPEKKASVPARGGLAELRAAAARRRKAAG